jgi:hypothetical protein
MKDVVVVLIVRLVIVQEIGGKHEMLQCVIHVGYN